MADTIEQARATLRRSQEQLLKKTNVVATGVGYKVTAGQRTQDLCIVCSVRQKQPSTQLAPKDLVPAAFDGVPTDVVETGPIRAFQSRTERQRPAPGGVSVGHRDITAGTFGCIVRRNGERFILSNNHVLANSNDAQIGDAILQPGPHDGGRYPADQIAVLYDFIPIQFPESPSGCSVARTVASFANLFAAVTGSSTRLRAVKARASTNLVDAAIARPLQDGDVTDDIVEIGQLQDVAQAELGLAIKKSGRTTGFTQGEISQIDVTVNVQYGPGQVATFSDQLLAGPMSQGGDSGSVVVDQDNRLVGLLFAGSDNSTIINRIEHVFSSLGLTL